MQATPAVEFVGIDKRFGAVHANRSVSFTMLRGSVHGVIGENGAGKSTLMSILYGFYQPDGGSIRLNGKPVQIRDSEQAISLGIGMVHQHFMLVEPFTVIENVLLGVEDGWRLAGGLKKARERLTELCQRYGLEVDLDAVTGELPVGVQQRVEILKALYRDAQVLVLDEPTAVLTPQEADRLFEVLQALRAEGKTVVLITHKLREVMHITDRVTVMRAGALVAEVNTRDTSSEQLAELMVGRKLQAPAGRTAMPPGREVLRVENLSLRDARGVMRLEGLSLEVHEGEILGIAGVSGNGQSELLQILSGIAAPSTGSMALMGQDVSRLRGPLAPARLRELGVAHVPEDRLREGLVKPFAAYENAVLGYQRDAELRQGRLPLLAPPKLLERCRRFMQGFDVRPPDPLLRAALFSGGNQQKLVLAREIDRDPVLLLVGQPTRGVDVGAIEFIHRRLLELRAAGKAIVLVSAELEELLALADRIVVLCGGRVTGRTSREAANERTLGLWMAGEAA